MCKNQDKKGWLKLGSVRKVRSETGPRGKVEELMRTLWVKPRSSAVSGDP